MNITSSSNGKEFSFVFKTDKANTSNKDLLVLLPEDTQAIKEGFATSIKFGIKRFLASNPDSNLAHRRVIIRTVNDALELQELMKKRNFEFSTHDPIAPTQPKAYAEEVRDVWMITDRNMGGPEKNGPAAIRFMQKLQKEGKIGELKVMVHSGDDNLEGVFKEFNGKQMQNFGRVKSDSETKKIQKAFGDIYNKDQIPLFAKGNFSIGHVVPFLSYFDKLLGLGKAEDNQSTATEKETEHQKALSQQITTVRSNGAAEPSAEDLMAASLDNKLEDSIKNPEKPTAKAQETIRVPAIKKANKKEASTPVKLAPDLETHKDLSQLIQERRPKTQIAAEILKAKSKKEETTKLENTKPEKKEPRATTKVGINFKDPSIRGSLAGQWYSSFSNILSYLEHVTDQPGYRINEPIHQELLEQAKKTVILASGIYNPPHKIEDINALEASLNKSAKLFEQFYNTVKAKAATSFEYQMALKTINRVIKSDFEAGIFTGKEIIALYKEQELQISKVETDLENFMSSYSGVNIEEGLKAEIDPTLLRKVIRALRKNASKAISLLAPSIVKGRPPLFINQEAIEMFAKADGDDLVITVADRGIGISPRDAEYIFGQNNKAWHEQGSRSQSNISERDKETRGNGLALAKRAVELAGGTLKLINTGRKDHELNVMEPEERTTFEIRFPNAVTSKNILRPQSKLSTAA